MNKTIKDKKAKFQELIELCKDKREDIDEDEIYLTLYESLEEYNCLDTEYLKSLDSARDKYSQGSNHPYYAIMPHVKELTFDECCSMLTFILRAERWTEGWLNECLSNGDIYKLLSRAYEVM